MKYFVKWLLMNRDLFFIQKYVGFSINTTISFIAIQKIIFIIPSKSIQGYNT